MPSKLLKYLSFILILAVLIGVLAGSQAPIVSMDSVTSTTVGDLFVTVPTVSDTAVPDTTEPPATHPTVAEPIPSEPTPPETESPSISDPKPTIPTLGKPIIIGPEDNQLQSIWPNPCTPWFSEPESNPHRPNFPGLESKPEPEPEPKPVPEPETDIEIPSINANYAFVYDLRTGKFLYNSCKTSKSLYPASTTKLYTTYVALQYLDLDHLVTVGEELSYVERDASVAGFKQGDIVSVEALAYGALLPSGCDASYILAAAAGREILDDPDATAKEAIKAFMAECNRLGKKWGMKNTKFTTADGYHHSKHYISVQAFAIIGKLCLEDADIARITASASATITYTNAEGDSCTKAFKNTNRTLHKSEKKYYHSAAVGLKTGFTSKAGYCLLTAYQVEDGYILVGVFDCDDANDRFVDANKLFDAFTPYL